MEQAGGSCPPQWHGHPTPDTTPVLHPARPPDTRHDVRPAPGLHASPTHTPHTPPHPNPPRPLLDAVVRHFAAVTASAGASLRRGIIHSDANERNVLVDEDAAAAATAQEEEQAAAGPGGGATGTARDGSAAAGKGPALITGLLDWGDASWCWLAAEPAAAAVYMMLLEAHIREPLRAARAVLAGYETELPLEDAERAALRTLCCARLVQSLSLGAYAAAREPSNAEYLLGTQRNGWRLLRLLWALADEQFLAALGRAHAGSNQGQ